MRLKPPTKMALYFLVLTLVYLAVAGEKSKEAIKIWPEISECMSNQPTPRATYPQKQGFTKALLRETNG